MSGQLTPDQLRERFKGKKWVMPYNRLTTIVDPKTQNVLYIEEYGPKNGVFVEGWRALHYPLTSSLVQRTYREGSATLAIISQGETELDLKPSLAPFGISSCKVAADSVYLSFAGLGGAGVSAAYSRGMAENVISVEIHSEGGGIKVGSSTIRSKRYRLLLIGVDDTDNDEEGATYALVDSVSREACKLTETRYLSHVNVQLYPYNEYKTRNCFATVVAIVLRTTVRRKRSFHIFVENLKGIRSVIKRLWLCMRGSIFSDEFMYACTELKFRMLHDLSDLKRLANDAQVEQYIITGKRGFFGAIGALGYWDRPDFAAKLPRQCI